MRLKDGNARAFTKDGGSYAFDRSEYARLLADWQAGKAFFTGAGIYSQATTIKLAEVQGVVDFSPESMRECDEDMREEKKESMLNGDE